MIQIGKYNTLRVRERVDSGLRLGAEPYDVLLPRTKVPKGTQIGDLLKVFVYTDSEDRPVATTETPKAIVGDFALLEVIDVSRHGAFLDWGLDKDLIVPTKEQHSPLRVGDMVVVVVMLDRDERVMGGARLAAHFDKRVSHLSVGQQVEILVYGFSDRGVRVVAAGRHSGMLFRDQTFRRMAIGDKTRAWITGIRADGRLDLALKSPNRSAPDDARRVLIAAIKANDGFLPIHDKSPPAEIQRHLQISKQAFKRAAGALYKSRKIAFVDGGIRWIEDSDQS